jgi:hypothetical protein
MVNCGLRERLQVETRLRHTRASLLGPRHIWSLDLLVILIISLPSINTFGCSLDCNDGLFHVQQRSTANGRASKGNHSRSIRCWMEVSSSIYCLSVQWWSASTNYTSIVLFVFSCISHHAELGFAITWLYDYTTMLDAVSVYGLVDIRLFVTAVQRLDNRKSKQTLTKIHLKTQIWNA